MKRLPIAMLAMSLAPPLLAATEAEVQRCRALAADAARLACYDALFGRPGAAATPAAVAPAAIAGPAAAATAVTPAAAATATPDAASGFGLPAAAPEEISSFIPGRFEGWEPNTRIKLANGQVWQVTDGSRGVYRLDDPKVRIRKGMLGSYFLEIEGQNQSPRVRRVQ